MTNIGTPHPVVGVPNAIVSEDDHHPMIQLSDDSSEDPIPLPLDFDELATPSTDRSHEKSVLAPQHVQSSVTPTPHIQRLVVHPLFPGQHRLEHLTGFCNL